MASKAIIFNLRNSGIASSPMAPESVTNAVPQRLYKQESADNQMVEPSVSSKYSVQLLTGEMNQQEVVASESGENPEPSDLSRSESQSGSTRPVRIRLVGKLARRERPQTTIKLVGEHALRQTKTVIVGKDGCPGTQSRRCQPDIKIKLVGKYRVSLDDWHRKQCRFQRKAMVLGFEELVRDQDQRYVLGYTSADENGRILYIYDRKMKYLVYHWDRDNHKTIEESYLDHRLVYLKDVRTDKHIYIDEGFVDPKGEPMGIERFRMAWGRWRICSRLPTEAAVPTDREGALWL